MNRTLRVKSWLKTTAEIDYSIRKCSNCNLYNSNHSKGDTDRKCELDLQDKCVTSTGNLNHGDYWIDNQE
jgi:hypothetical protein